MAGDTANPRIWTNADAYEGPVGTVAPTDVTTALNAAYKALGLTSEDGFTQSREEDITDHYARGGILVRTTRSKHKRTFKVIALEDNPTVFSLVNPGSSQVTASGVTTRIVKTPSANPRSFVLEETDGAYKRRLHIARGEILEVADIVSDDDSMTMFELTINVYPSSTGVLYTEITSDPAAVVV